TRGFAGSRCATAGTLPAFTISATSGDSLKAAAAAAVGAAAAVAFETAKVGAGAFAAVGFAAGVLPPVALPVAGFVGSAGGATGAAPPQAVTAAAAATDAESLRKFRRLRLDVTSHLPDLGPSPIATRTESPKARSSAFASPIASPRGAPDRAPAAIG